MRGDQPVSETQGSDEIDLLLFVCLLAFFFLASRSFVCLSTGWLNLEEFQACKNGALERPRRSTYPATKGRKKRGAGKAPQRFEKCTIGNSPHVRFFCSGQLDQDLWGFKQADIDGRNFQVQIVKCSRNSEEKYPPPPAKFHMRSYSTLTELITRRDDGKRFQMIQSQLHSSPEFLHDQT